VIKGADTALENTRQGKLKFYISLWTEVAARAMDLMTMEIEANGHTGKHRHIFEEMIYVQGGQRLRHSRADQISMGSRRCDLHPADDRASAFQRRRQPGAADLELVAPTIP
jgi:hypothetical protein